MPTGIGSYAGLAASAAPVRDAPSSISNFKIIGQGPDNNFLVHTNFHVTINAIGDVTVTHDNTSVECR